MSDRAYGSRLHTIGTHLSSDDGACLMEVVSQAAGEPWSDSPECTHELVAHLARCINDSSSEAGREELLCFVPSLTQANSDEYVVYPKIALVCTSLAMRLRPSALLALLDYAARRQLRAEAVNPSPQGCTRVGRWLYRRGPAHRAIEAAVTAAASLPTAERDTWLRGLLDAAISAASSETGLAEPAVESRRVCTKGAMVLLLGIAVYLAARIRPVLV